MNFQHKRETAPKSIQSKLGSLFKIPSVGTLVVIATCSLLIDASVQGLLFSTFLIAIAICVACSAAIKNSLNLLVRWGKGAKRRSLALQCLPSLIMIASFLLSSLTTGPAYAQTTTGGFLSNAETFFTTLVAGAGVPANLIGLVFGVLRAIFVIYIAIAVIRVVVAARNDDDWTTLARTPLIVIMAIVIGDLTAGMVIGTTGTTPTTPVP